jgi:hypothetical protein
MPKAKNKALGWAEKCAKSNGAQILLTGENKKLGDEFKKVLDAFRTKEDQFIKEKKEFLLDVDSFWLKIKRNLYESGVKLALDYDLDLDDQAMEEGQLVVNLTKPRPKNMMGM